MTWNKKLCGSVCGLSILTRASIDLTLIFFFLIILTNTDYSWVWRSMRWCRVLQLLIIIIGIELLTTSHIVPLRVLLAIVCGWSLGQASLIISGSSWQMLVMGLEVSSRWMIIGSLFKVGQNVIDIILYRSVLTRCIESRKQIRQVLLIMISIGSLYNMLIQSSLLSVFIREEYLGIGKHRLSSRLDNPLVATSNNLLRIIYLRVLLYLSLLLWNILRLLLLLISLIFGTWSLLLTLINYKELLSLLLLLMMNLLLSMKVILQFLI